MAVLLLVQAKENGKEILGAAVVILCNIYRNIVCPHTWFKSCNKMGKLAFGLRTENCCRNKHEVIFAVEEM
jgi:hypothetical protein